MYSLPAIAGVFSIDPDHAQIGFSAMHMMIYNVKGTFKQLKGEFELDESNMLVSPNVEIKTSSIDTKFGRRGSIEEVMPHPLLIPSFCFLLTQREGMRSIFRFSPLG